MLLFNGFRLNLRSHWHLFKNILCYCSTGTAALAGVASLYLKTSYVIVQRGSVESLGIEILFKNILCYCSTYQKQMKMYL